MLYYEDVRGDANAHVDVSFDACVHANVSGLVTWAGMHVGLIHVHVHNCEDNYFGHGDEP